MYVGPRPFCISLSINEMGTSPHLFTKREKERKKESFIYVYKRPNSAYETNQSTTVYVLWISRKKDIKEKRITMIVMMG